MARLIRSRSLSRLSWVAAGAELAEPVQNAAIFSPGEMCPVPGVHGRIRAQRGRIGGFGLRFGGPIYRLSGESVIPRLFFADGFGRKRAFAVEGQALPWTLSGSLAILRESPSEEAGELAIPFLEKARLSRVPRLVEPIPGFAGSQTVEILVGPNVVVPAAEDIELLVELLDIAASGNASADAIL